MFTTDSPCGNFRRIIDGRSHDLKFCCIKFNHSSFVWILFFHFCDPFIPSSFKLTFRKRGTRLVVVVKNLFPAIIQFQKRPRTFDGTILSSG